jgi:uncharacterized protein DUF4331
VSHHADSPLARKHPRLDLCDLYVFAGTAGTVLVQTLNPLSGGGGFFPGGQYGFHVSRGADGYADLTYRTVFREHEGSQLLDVYRVEGPAAAGRDAPGTAVAGGIAETLIEGDGGLRVWAGRAADPCWEHGAVLDAARECITGGRPFDPLMALPVPALNLLAGSDVHAIVIEVPAALLGQSPVSVWATTAMPTAGGWVQVNRCGHPYLSALFGLQDEAAGLDHNSTWPHEDAARYGDVVREGAARAARALGTSADPDAHGARVADILLPDVITCGPGTSARFEPGTAGGRGLADPAAEVMISLAAGTHVPFGLGPDSASGSLRATFPYLGAPVAGPGGPLMF